MRITSKAALVATLLCVLVGSTQAVDYRDEYEKKIKASQDVGVLGDDLAGDQVNFFTGQVSFKTTDVRVPGNAFDLTVTRTMDVAYDDYFADDTGPLPGVDDDDVQVPKIHSFGLWDLDVPRISTIMTQTGGWVVDSATPTKRCGVTGLKSGGAPVDGAPPTVNGTRGMPLGPAVYFSGYQIHTESGEQSMLFASLPNTNRPSVGGPYYWTTNKDWWVSCLPTTANNVGGEGFLVVSPEGKKYYFDWLSKRHTNEVHFSYTDPTGQKAWTRTSHIYRSDYWMLPTRIEDRFGNWVKYSWSSDAWAQLQSITAGKKDSSVADQTINVHYNALHFVDWIKDGTRTWTYTYGGNNELDKVILPDGTFWQYNMATYAVEAQRPYCDGDSTTQDWYWICFGGGTVFPSGVAGSITHPSGATVYFEFDNHFQYSSFQPASYPLSLVKKSITAPPGSGTGFGPVKRTWHMYYPLKEDIKAGCQAGACPAYALRDYVTDVGHVTRQIFSYDGVLRGELEGSTTNNGGGSPQITTAPWGTAYLTAPTQFNGLAPYFYRETENRYVVPNQTRPYVERVAVNPLGSIDPEANIWMSERRLPIESRYLYQQGVTFSTASSAFDTFARPASVTRASSGSAGGAFTRNEVTIYADNPAKWVIGQVASVTSGGKVMSQTDYDPTYAVPTKIYSFGVVQQEIAYDTTDGTVSSVKDGAGNTITVSGWKRGVPQRIDYPTAAGAPPVNEQAVVDEFGNLTSVTDEMGGVTNYTYDTMGRLSGIVYPSEAPTWNPLSRGLVKTTTQEIAGIPPGSWKQTVKTGATATGFGQTTTYYDERFHPVLILTEDTNNTSSRSYVVKKYDAAGREVFSSYPVDALSVAQGIDDTSLKGVTTSYDALGRPVLSSQYAEASVGPVETKTEYLSGFQTKVTNPRGQSTTTTYQVFDEPETDAPVKIQAPESVTTTIIRDRFGKPLTITRSGPGL